MCNTINRYHNKHRSFSVNSHLSMEWAYSRVAYELLSLEYALSISWLALQRPWRALVNLVNWLSRHRFVK